MIEKLQRLLNDKKNELDAFALVLVQILDI